MEVSIPPSSSSAVFTAPFFISLIHHSCPMLPGIPSACRRQGGNKRVGGGAVGCLGGFVCVVVQWQVSAVGSRRRAGAREWMLQVGRPTPILGDMHYLLLKFLASNMQVRSHQFFCNSLNPTLCL